MKKILSTVLVLLLSFQFTTLKANMNNLITNTEIDVLKNNASDLYGENINIINQASWTAGNVWLSI